MRLVAAGACRNRRSEPAAAQRRCSL